MTSPFGLWKTTGGTDSGHAPSTPLWQVDLPADLQGAHAILAQAEGSLADTQAALAEAERRLIILAETIAESISSAHPFTSEITNQPEQALIAFLVKALPGLRLEAMGLSQENHSGLAEAAEDLRAFIDQVHAILAGDSWVETRIEGQLIAQSRLSRMGVIETTWLEEADGAHHATHLRSLKSALAGQRLMLDVLTGTAHGASIIIRLIEDAGFKTLVLSLIYQFIHNVRVEHQP